MSASIRAPLFNNGMFNRISTTQLVGSISVLGLLSILVVTIGLAWGERVRLLRDAAEKAGVTSFFLSDHAGRLFEVGDVALRATTAALGNEPWDAIAKNRSLFEQMQAESRALPYVEDVWLNDSRGTLRLTSFAFPSPPSDASDRLAFRLARDAEPGLVVGERIVGKVTGRATFLISRRLSWPDGSFRGMVSATADLAYFSDFWQRLQLPYQAHVSLTRDITNEVMVRIPAGQSDMPPSETIAARSKVGELPLFVTVTIDRSSVLAVWHRWLFTSVPISLMTIAALAGLSLLAFRQGRREAIANAAVREAQARLAAANSGLEMTVAERTADLSEANDEVQRFAYLVSHDLRAPLVNVLGFTGEVESIGRELLQQGDTSPDPGRLATLERDFGEAIGFIRAGTTKMDRLLTHILTLAREGKRVLHAELLDMDELVRGVADAVRFQAEAAGVRIEVRGLPHVEADRLAAEQVFGNLLDNAVKYLDPSRAGHIVVTGRVEANRVLYEVSDNGRGIDPKDHERVFDLFRRAGSQDVQGDGIGLAYVRTLVRAMGGRIALRSVVGQGTVFTVNLPRGAQT